MIIGKQQVSTAGLTQQQVATGLAPTATATADSKADVLVAKLGGVEAIEEAAAAMVEATKLELKLKALKKKSEIFEKNAKALANELKITEEITLNGVSHSVVVTPKKSSTNEVEDKIKLYNFLEAKTPGLYFQLSSIAIGDLKNYVPDTKWSSAGLKVVPKSAIAISGKVKG